MNGVGTEEIASRLFDQFVNAVTCKSVFNTFHELCTVLGLQHVDHHNFYKCLKSRLTSWRAKSIWDKFDKRAAHRDYRGGAACAETRVLIIGAGPCGLRMAIEAAFLGAKTVVVEKRDRFSRNNVLHLWPFLITDLKNLGAKKFFGKFAAGAIDHISIRQLQCILLKVALLLGVEVHVNVSFSCLVEPPEDQTDHMGWRCKVDPENHPVSEYQFDVLIGADGKRNTLSGFTRKEFRGKLAIAITANFINKNTTAEASVEEISGVAFIFNQKFFTDLKDKTGIDLENIVYYKDETHYFVMTAKKQSLFAKGVLKEDYADTIQLLARENVNQDALMAYAKEAANVSTNYQLPNLEFAVNHYGQADLAMFDFTSMFAAENSSRVVEKNSHKLLMGIVGDSLLEPFWPTGSGCARGFLGAFDTAWMIKNWAAGKMRPLEILAERESIFQLLSQTTPESLHKLHHHYSIDPNTRYPNLNTIRILKPSQVRHLYDGGDAKLLDEEIPSKRRKQDGLVDPYSLLRWCQKILNNNIYRHVHIIDFTTSWKSGLALCALIHAFKPDLINFNQLLESNPLHNNQLALTIAEKELGINPVMSADDIASSDIPDRLNMMAYLSQYYRVFRTEPVTLVPIVQTRSLSKDEKNIRSPKHRTSFLQKLSSKLNKSKRKKEEEDKTFHKITHEEKLEERQNIELTKYKKLPMDEIANKLTVTNKAGTSYTPFSQKSKEEAQGAVSVNAMAEILAAKFRGDVPAQPVVKRLKGTPTLAAAQPNSEFCKFCAKRVYIMERMSAEGVFFHRGCLKCDFCGVNLRLNNYTVEREPDVKFFCFRHAIREQRLAAKRKRLLEEDIKENIPNDIGKKTPGESRSRTILKTPDTVLSPLRVNNIDLLDQASKTPERAEFENTFDGLEEESEEEQFEHNLRASLSSDTLLDDEDDDSSYSDSEGSLSDTEMARILDEWSGAEDEDVLLDVTEGLGNQSITWEEACQLAKSWSTRHSTENLLKASTKDEVEEETPYTKLEEDNDEDMDDESDEDGDDEETEVEDSEYESEEETETEGEDAESEVITNKPAISSSPVKSPISPSVLAARASFFSSPPEVVRIDAFSMFKSKETKKAEEQNARVLAEEEAQKAAEVKEASVKEALDVDVLSDKEEDSKCLPSESISEDISTDKSKITVMSVDDMEDTDGELDQDSDQEDSLAEDSQEDNEDDLLGKTAVSKEMERLLAEIDDKDTSSENDRLSLNSMTEPPCEDVEFHKQLVKASEMKDEVFGNEDSDISKSTSKSALDNVKLDTVTSEDTLQQVLNSVKAMETSSDEEGGKLMDQSLKTMDERFVTDRRHKSKKVKRSQSASSGSSFTISTPSCSPKSSTSSLADVVEYNKELLDDGKDEKPDEDMLLDYTNTMSMVLDDESNDDDLPEDGSQVLKEGDQTIKDENADNTLRSNESSYYMTPDASVVEVKEEGFKTPLEDTHISSEDQKKAPIFNLHDEVSKQQEQKEEMVTDKIKEVPSLVVSSPKSPPKDISESDFAKNINENQNVSSTPMKREPIKPTPSKSPERPVEVEKKPYRKLPDLPPVRRWTPGGGRSPTKPVSATVTKPISSVLNTPAVSKANSSSTPFATPIGKLTTEKKSTVPSKADTKVKRTSSNSSMSDSNRSRSGSLSRRKGVHVDKDKPKVKVALDRNRLSSQTKTPLKSTGPEKSFPAEKGRKKIPLDSSLTKGDTLLRPMHDRKSIDEDNDDIPFADDESENGDVFSTPMTSVKQKPAPKPRDEDMEKQVRKRLLPIPPSARTNKSLVNGNSDQMRANTKAPTAVAFVNKTFGSGISDQTRINTKAPSAVAFVNKTFGSESPKVVLRNSSTEDGYSRSTSYDTQSTSDIVSDSDDKNASAKVNVSSKTGKYTKKKLKSTDVTRIGKTPKSDTKVKMRKTDDRSDSDTQNKKEKRRSFLDMLKPKTPEKSKSVSEVESGTPKNNTSAVKSKSKKVSKSENKFDKKKDKAKRAIDSIDSSLSENMKGLQIGASSMFSTSHKARQPILSATMHAPTANIDEFSDSDESIMSTSTVHSRRRDNHMSMSMDLDGDARRARKIQKAIIKQQKLNEQKRLRMAQELQRQLEEVEVKQKELEERGIQVEKDLRDSGKDDADLMQEWFNLVHEKNTIVRFESSLMIQARELELEDRQARLNNLLRDRMSIEGGGKEDGQIEEEKKILDELLQVVEQRDSLVAMLEEDRLRESAEDKDLEQIMLAKGFALSPMSYVKSMKADAMKADASSPVK